MAEVKLVFQSQHLDWDIVLDSDGKDLDTDEGLYSMVVICLFTDRRALRDDVLPHEGGPRRGWWGDLLWDAPNTPIGSRLWLLTREKNTPETWARAEEYCKEALEILVQEEIAAKVEVRVDRHLERDDAMRIWIDIYKRDGNKEAMRFDYVWQDMQVIAYEAA